jgi:hypothetical protein
MHCEDVEAFWLLHRNPIHRHIASAQRNAYSHEMALALMHCNIPGEASYVNNCSSQVDAGVKGVSPGPFTEEFLTRQQRTLRILGGLCMAGDAQQCSASCRHFLPATQDETTTCLAQFLGDLL